MSISIKTEKYAKIGGGMGIVYMLYNTDDYKVYIGSTQYKLNDRFSKHKYRCGSKSSKIYDHMRYVGIKNFIIREIKRVPIKDLLETEDFYIRLYGLGSDFSLNDQRAKRNKKEWIKDNKEHLTEYRKKWVEDNEENQKEYRKKYYEDNKDVLTYKKKEYYEQNREREIARVKQYNKDNKDVISARRKEHYQKNKDVIAKRREENKDVLIEKRRLKYIEDRDRYRCEPCGYTAPQQHKLNEHCKTKRHEKNMKISSGELVFIFNCLPCHYHTNNKDLYKAHSKQAGHIQKVGTTTTTTEELKSAPMKVKFRCEICDTDIRTNTSLKIHNKSKKHIKLVKIASGELTFLYNCLPCHYHSNHKQNYASHLEQDKHVRSNLDK